MKPNDRLKNSWNYLRSPKCLIFLSMWVMYNDWERLKQAQGKSHYCLFRFSDLNFVNFIQFEPWAIQYVSDSISESSYMGKYIELLWSEKEHVFSRSICDQIEVITDDKFALTEPDQWNNVLSIFKCINWHFNIDQSRSFDLRFLVCQTE